MKERITSTKGDDKGTVDSLITFLQNSKRKGATHYNMEWSRGPMWAFKWFNTYRVLTDEEIKQQEIKELEERLTKLKQ